MRDRMAEIEATRTTRLSAREDAERTFWAGVDRLLESAYPDLRREREEDEAGARLMDELDARRARELRAEREELSRWLDDE